MLDGFLFSLLLPVYKCNVISLLLAFPAMAMVPLKPNKLLSSLDIQANEIYFFLLQVAFDHGIFHGNRKVINTGNNLHNSPILVDRFELGKLLITVHVFSHDAFDFNHMHIQICIGIKDSQKCSKQRNTLCHIAYISKIITGLIALPYSTLPIYSWSTFQQKLSITEGQELQGGKNILLFREGYACRTTQGGVVGC